MREQNLEECIALTQPLYVGRELDGGSVRGRYWMQKYVHGVNRMEIGK